MYENFYSPKIYFRIIMVTGLIKLIFERQKKRQMSLLLFGVGIHSRKDAWQNGCFRKMDDHLVHTTTNHHFPKWMFFRNVFFKSSLGQIGQCGSQVHPPNRSDDLCLFFCLFLLCAHALPQ